MAISFNKKIVLGTTSIAAVLLASASQAFAMSPFQANYQFSYNGKNMGSATRTLSQAGNNWTYVFSAKAGGVASASETSRFTFSNGKISSSSFSRTSKILVHNNSMNIKFNPSSKTISTKKDDKVRSFAWQAGVLDELNAELQLREDLKAGGLKSSYLIADAKEVEARRFIKSGTERVTTNYGTFDTVKVILKPSKPNRSTTFWLAPKLDYLPVKVTHQDGKTSYGLSLTAYKGKTN
jgi:hypothetical protein